MIPVNNNLAKKFRDNKFSNLNDVYRWSGLHLLEPESDASHVFLVQAMIIQMVNIDPEIKNELDIKDTIYRAFMHDFDEACSGDVVRTLKYANEEIRTAIVSTQSKLMRNAWTEEICSDVDNSMEDGTAESLVVRFFDTYAAYDKMRKEVNLGNRYMATQLQNCKSFIVKYNFGVLADGNYPHTYELMNALKYELIKYCDDNAIKCSEL